MENYDNLFEQQPEQTKQPFDREVWAQQKREQRQELYNLIEEMSEKTLTDPSALSDYLNMQARLGKTLRPALPIRCLWWRRSPTRHSSQIMTTGKSAGAA